MSNHFQFGEISRTVLHVAKNTFYKGEIDRQPSDVILIIAMNDRDLMSFKIDRRFIWFVEYPSDGCDRSVIHRDRRLWCVHLLLLYAHVVDCWCDGLRVHRIDVIALIAIEFNARDAATSPANKINEGSLVPLGENKRNVSLYIVQQLYALRNLSPYTRETYIYIVYIKRAHVSATSLPRHVGARVCTRGDATCTRAIKNVYFLHFLN